MFLNFFHLHEQPFGVTPDPAYLYPSRTHCEALASLRAGILGARGFLALVAEPGMGKTTLLYELLDELRDSARTVFLFQTQCDSREFFAYVLSELGIDAQGMGLVEMHNKLNAALFDQMFQGKRFVMIVDEAQNLDEPVLETIRLLSNFETQHTKLLQIILAGQPQLAEKLAQPRLAQLRQRIAVLSQLQPLTLEETAGYIDFRLKMAGYRGEPLFAPEAVALISQRSRGVPRVINNICYDALALAHSQGRQRISTEIVQEVITELDVEAVAAHPATIVAPAASDVVVPEAMPAVAAAAAAACACANSSPIAGSRLEGGPEAGPKADPVAAVPDSTASPLTYKPVTQSSLGRWAIRGVALITIFLLGSVVLFSSILSHTDAGTEENASISSHEGSICPTSAFSSRPFGFAPVSYDAAPQEADFGQILTVETQPQQTLEQISLLYAGQYDRKFLKEICTLNPGLKDADHLGAGQLVRIPLPRGTLKKVFDATEKVRGVSKGQADTSQLIGIDYQSPKLVAQKR